MAITRKRQTKAKNTSTSDNKKENKLVNIRNKKKTSNKITTPNKVSIKVNSKSSNKKQIKPKTSNSSKTIKRALLNQSNDKKSVKSSKKVNNVNNKTNEKPTDNSTTENILTKSTCCKLCYKPFFVNNIEENWKKLCISCYLKIQGVTIKCDSCDKEFLTQEKKKSQIHLDN